MSNANVQMNNSIQVKKNVSIVQFQSLQKKLPGLGLVFLIGIIANSVGKDFPLIGGAVIAILIGILVRNFLGVPAVFMEGVSYTLKKLLKVAIVLLGFGLSFANIFSVGLNSIVVVLVSVISGISLTYFIAKAFGLKGNIPLLVSFGTGICGATAIATTGPIIKAKESDIAYAVNTIFAFNVLAVLIYPLIGQFFSMPDNIFGIWAGAAIHDTSSVVAAGYSYSNSAGDASVVVKLIRTLMLIPVSIIASIYFSIKINKNKSSNVIKIRNVFPYFVLIFAAAAAINTIFTIPTSITSHTDAIAKFLILMVMASVGLGTDFKKIKSVGFRPLLVGLISSVIMGAISISLIYLMF